MDELQNKILHEEKQEPDSFLNSKPKQSQVIYYLVIQTYAKNTLKQGNAKGNIQANSYLHREAGEWDKEDTLREI